MPAALGALLLSLPVFVPEPSRVTLDSFGRNRRLDRRALRGRLPDAFPDAGENGRGALRMDYDFRGHGGWAAARKDFSRALPENWAIRLRLRGEGPPQTLEFKLLDPSGKNVWWSVRRDFAFPSDWTTLTIRKRQVTFAWGPAGGGVLTDLGAIEITVTAASGGRGRVWIDELALDILPPPGAPPAPLGEWRSAPGSGEEQTVRLDLGGRREIGGLSLFWDAADYARLYDVEVSDDGSRWRLARSIAGGRGGRAWIFLPETDAALVRLRLHESARGRGYALRDLRAEPPEIADSPTKFLEAVARDSPRGRWPRSLVGEQIYWTLVGVDGGSEKGLLSEDGALETGRGDYSVEPFLRANGRFLGWAEADRIDQSLEEGDLPIPSVRRTYAGGMALAVTAYADGPAESSTMHARYRVENSGAAAVSATLYLTLRPVQVNPPWQFLSTQGGAAAIRRIHWDGRSAAVEDAPPVYASTPPTACGATSFTEGEIVTRLADGDLPKSSDAADPDGLASAALSFELTVPPGGARDVVIAVPLATKSIAANHSLLRGGPRLGRPRPGGRSSRGSRSAVPPEAEPLARAARSNLAWILINREGPRIRPGSRSYARSWIRDGSLTSVALMRLGHAEEAGAFLRWFAPYQFESGMVPCCVDARGADPVPENDSHGELIYLAASYLRYTGDRASVETVWPQVVKAADYIDVLRRQRRTDEYRTGEKRLYFGLLPESISHEGYSSRPVHSYWDDFFGIRGLADAAWLARTLGRDDEARRFAASETEMRQDVLASIRAVIAEKHLDFIPGSADLGDFDATSTTIALDPGGEQARLPAVELARTFDIYWERFEKRASNRRAAGNEYTPYEWRVAGSFVRLGRRDRAQALFDFFMADRRPSGWNHWAEVVWNEPRMPKFIGDMPHGWVGSDFLRSFLDLFAYEGAGGSLVLGAGLPPSWLRVAGGAAVRGLRTPYGMLDVSVAQEGADVRYRIGGTREAARGLRRGVAARRPALRCPRGRAARRARPARTCDRAFGAGGDPDAGAALVTAARRLPSNRYGHFSEDGREFVVTDPRPPRPWTNVIANQRVGPRRQPHRQRILVDRQLAARGDDPLAAGPRGGPLGQVPLRARRRRRRGLVALAVARVGAATTATPAATASATPSSRRRSPASRRAGRCSATPRRPSSCGRSSSPTRRAARAGSTWSASSSGAGRVARRRGASSHKLFLETWHDPARRAVFARNHMWDVPSPRFGHWNTSFPYVSAFAATEPLTAAQGDKAAFLGRYGDFARPPRCARTDWTPRLRPARRSDRGPALPGRAGAARNAHARFRPRDRRLRRGGRGPRSTRFTQRRVRWTRRWRRSARAGPTASPRTASRRRTPALDCRSRTTGSATRRSRRDSGRRCGYYQQSGAFGFRDQLQDSQVWLTIDPPRCRAQIDCTRRTSSPTARSTTGGTRSPSRATSRR